MSLHQWAASCIAAARSHADRLAWCFALLATPATLAAQQGYYNLDAGRPTRIEDAVPTERYAFELVWGSLRLERLTGGVERWRTEPKAVFGVLPFTEVEIRVPVVRSIARASGSGATGFGGVGFGMLHALSVETYRRPAVALASEVMLPAGGPFGAPRATFSVKALLTRTTPLARFHLNASAGTWSIHPPPAAATCTFVAVGGTCLDGKPVGAPIDFPCGAGPADLPSPAAAATASTPADFKTDGNRWLVGFGADRALPLRSLLIAGDVYAERFFGLYPRTDWTAELGARHQLTPRLVLDLGMTRRFAGTVLSSSGSVGFTWSAPTRGMPDDRD